MVDAYTGFIRNVKRADDAIKIARTTKPAFDRFLQVRPENIQCIVDRGVLCVGHEEGEGRKAQSDRPPSQAIPEDPEVSPATTASYGAH